MGLCGTEEIDDPADFRTMLPIVIFS
jgi:hypothetical protein